MVGKRKFEEQIAALDALRSQPVDVRIPALRKALGNRNNFCVGKAADLVREFRIEELTTDLLTALEHFFENAAKNDPQCWAKNGLSRALAALEYQEAEPYLRGMHHIQMEPVWGGQSDTAGTLRATCALGLVQCRSLSENDLLAHLIDLLADKDKSVRMEIVRAIEQIGSPAAAIVLRTRAVLGADEPEILGACYTAIVNLEGKRAIPWLSRFLKSADDFAAEAALAIAGTHSEEGLLCLMKCMEDARDAWWRSVLLSAIALTRQDGALDYLLGLIRNDSSDAEAAMDAVLRAVPPPDVLARVEEAVAGNPRLTRHLAASRKSSAS